ncbi:unnamed protein product [Phaeothamnion confervicola]
MGAHPSTAGCNGSVRGHAQSAVSVEHATIEEDEPCCAPLGAAWNWWYKHIYMHPVEPAPPPSSRRLSRNGRENGGTRDSTPLLRGHRTHTGTNGASLGGYGGATCGSASCNGGSPCGAASGKAKGKAGVPPRNPSPSGIAATAAAASAAAGPPPPPHNFATAGEHRNGNKPRRQPLQNSYSEGIIRDYERQDVPEEFAKIYDMRMLIGVGTTAKVFLCVRRATDKKFACKVIDKRRLDFDYEQKELLLSQLRKEIEILRQLDHPNIVKFEDVIETANMIYVVMELVTGGELFDHLLENGSMSEPQAAHLMHGVMSAVVYMHDRGVVHRDLKAENLLLVQNGANWPEVKLIDFGFSTTLRYTLTGSFLGTGGYIAPEIRQQRSYSQSVDIWACGVLVYLVVSCRLPFNADVDVMPSGRKHAERRYELRFPDPQWTHRTEAVKDLIRHMLDVDPMRRFSARQVLKHPWITGQVFGMSFGTELPGGGDGGGGDGTDGRGSDCAGGGGGRVDGAQNGGSHGGDGSGSGGGGGGSGAIVNSLPTERPAIRHVQSSIDFQMHRSHMQNLVAPEEFKDEETDDATGEGGGRGNGRGGGSGGGSNYGRQWERTISYCPGVIHSVRTGDLMTTSRHSIQRYGANPIDRRSGSSGGGSGGGSSGGGGSSSGSGRRGASFGPPAVPMPVPQLSTSPNEHDSLEF